MAKHFRAPIFDTLRKKSPFTGLDEHAGKVHECAQALQDTLAAFLAGHHDEVASLAAKVSELEFEADQIKSNIRNHLPANVRMPVDKILFLQALSDQDRILDSAEDAAQWMDMRHTAVPEEIGVAMTGLLDKVVETLAAYAEVVANVKDLLETGFVKREREEEKQLIHRVHGLEHRTDILNRDLSRLLLAPEMEKTIGGVAVYHLLKLTLQISNIADHAENAGDRLRAMMSR